MRSATPPKLRKRPAISVAEGGGAVSISMLDVGEALFFNWRSLDWDRQEVGWGDNEIANPMNYVSASGVVRVRYTYKPPPAFASTGITFNRFDISAWGHAT